MRLFVAFAIPEAVRGAVGERIAAHRGELPDARWVRPENLHLTLVFVGEVEGAVRSALAAALAPVFAAAAPLTLRLAGAGTFPPNRPARVAWLGVEVGEGLPALQALQAAVAEAAERTAGVEVDPRPYVPHLTVARPRTPWRREDGERFARLFVGPFGDPFVVRRGELVESELGRGAGGGSRYTVLDAFPLQEAA